MYLCGRGNGLEYISYTHYIFYIKVITLDDTIDILC